MATATKEATNGKATTTGKDRVTIKPIAKVEAEFTIKGITPLLMHKWSEKARRQMREQQQTGKKTKTRDLRKPEDEAREATYTNADGDVGIPGMAFKKSLITAAHQDLGIPKTLVMKAIFLTLDNPDGILPIEYEEVEIREHAVRVKTSTDLRYRPEFRNWRCRVRLEVDSSLLMRQDLVNLITRAGNGTGVCEWRPEKGGEYGRYCIDESQPFTWKAMEPK